MAEDLDALATLFTLTPTVSPEEVRLCAVHHTLSQLIALGWLRLASGRWTTGLYVPAGGLAERMEWGS